MGYFLRMLETNGQNGVASKNTCNFIHRYRDRGITENLSVQSTMPRIPTAYAILQSFGESNHSDKRSIPLKIGLIGSPKSGKTTIFNALSKSQAEVSAFASTKTEPNIAIVDVRDERVTKLIEMYKPAKSAYAKIELVDFVGVQKDETKKEELFTTDLMRLVKTMDSIAVVIRNFTSELTGATSGAASDLDKIEEELLLSDLIIAEKRIERVAASSKGGQTAALAAEEKVLQKVIGQLNAMKPIRELTLTADEQKIIRGFQFLTQKPLFLILNSDEDHFKKDAGLIEVLAKRYKTIECAGSFEMELSRLADEQEIKAFMDDMGINESARDRLTLCAYETLGLISFFTVGEDEVRAWELTRGASAVDAAGAIHTDLARGFIRAECFSYADLTECGGTEKTVKDKGKFRMEGKDYIVKDGDILSIRFNV
jgi:ribosome-binding ATPase